MNKLKEELMKLCFWQGKLTGKESKELFDWINQNYISKQQILNLECLKEEEEFSWDYKEGDGDKRVRNETKREIKEEINNLK